MAYTDNLVHFTSDQDRDKARENGRKGGKASGEARRRRKAMREALDEILSREFTDRNGKKAQGVEAMCARVFQDAMDGDMNAVKFIRDTVGEMPVQRVETVQIDQKAYDDVKRILMGDDEE